MALRYGLSSLILAGLLGSLKRCCNVPPYLFFHRMPPPPLLCSSYYFHCRLALFPYPSSVLYIYLIVSLVQFYCKDLLLVLPRFYPRFASQRLIISLWMFIMYYFFTDSAFAFSAFT